jgi:hypothetical protein
VTLLQLRKIAEMPAAHQRRQRDDRRALEYRLLGRSGLKIST